MRSVLRSFEKARWTRSDGGEGWDWDWELIGVALRCIAMAFLPFFSFVGGGGGDGGDGGAFDWTGLDGFDSGSVYQVKRQIGTGGQAGRQDGRE